MKQREKIVEAFFQALDRNGWSVIAGDAPLDYPNKEDVIEALNEELKDLGYK